MFSETNDSRNKDYTSIELIDATDFIEGKGKNRRIRIPIWEFEKLIIKIK